MKENAELNDPEYIFVYGTLRKGMGHPLNRALEAHATHAGPGCFAGKLYDLGSYPAAVPYNDNRVPHHEGGMVTGDLYRLHRPERILPLLDRYEGCTDIDGSGADYRREACRVQRMPLPDGNKPDGESVRAWIYLYNRPTDGLKIIPGGDYLLLRHHQ